MPIGFLIPLIIFQCALCVLYMQTKHKKGFPRPVSSTFKTLATLSSAFTALYFAATSAQPYAWLICWGLFFGAAADYTLNYKPVPGVILFSLGHICYIAAMCLLKTPTRLNLLLTTGLILLDLILYFLIRSVAEKRSPLRRPGFALLYALILCPLVGMAVTQNLLIIIAVSCFVLSDILLAIRVTRNLRSRVLGYICLIFYYAAQLLFALSLAI